MNQNFLNIQLELYDSLLFFILHEKQTSSTHRKTPQVDPLWLTSVWDDYKDFWLNRPQSKQQTITEKQYQIIKIK